MASRMALHGITIRIIPSLSLLYMVDSTTERSFGIDKVEPIKQPVVGAQKH